MARTDSRSTSRQSEHLVRLYSREEAGPMLVRQADLAPFIPDRWEPATVGGRMVEAFAVLDRLPIKVWPKLFGTAMPAYLHDAEDRDGWEGSFKADVEADKNASIAKVRGATADQMSRMVEAIGWPVNIPDIVTRKMTGRWALARARKRNVRIVAERLGLTYTTFNRIRLRGLREIARHLNRENLPVTMHGGIS